MGNGLSGGYPLLDVHISWLRQAIEADPRHPRYIKTERVCVTDWK
jgi:DNA-binding response OmpR family regulator